MAAAITKILGVVVAIIVVVSLLPVLTETADSVNGEDNLEVLVIAGQSNAAYRQVDVSLINEEIPQPVTNVYYYGTSTQPIWFGYPSNPTYDQTLESYGIYSMVSNGQWKIGGYEPVLAESISKKSNCDVLIINVGISSATIANLTPQQIGGEYTAKVIEDALSKVDSKYNINKLGYVWIQGESNAGSTVDGYIQQFNIINDWYHEQGFEKCYMVQTRPANSGNAAIAQLKICQDDPSVILASTAPSTFTVDNGLMVSDDLHYSQQGRIVVGEDINSKISLTPHIRDSSVGSLLGVIPVVLIIGLLLAVTADIFVKRND